MEANSYQQQAARTLIDDPPEFSNEELDIIWLTVELIAVTGEMAEYVKKGICHQHGWSEQAIVHKAQLVRNALSNLDWYMHHHAGAVPMDLSNVDIMTLWNVLGLGGEVGEIAQYVGESISTGVKDDMHLSKELGDALWYTAGIATKQGIQLGDAMEFNIAKLKIRYPEGWSSADSQARVDVT